MSSEIVIDGKEYTLATHAGTHFEYTKDYLLMLIKEGKIDGQKIGHRWYVHMPSAELFFKRAKLEREERRTKISVERKDELKTYTTQRSKSNYKTALIETLVIVIIGLSVGASGYLGTTTHSATVAESGVSFFENIALSLYHFVTGEKEVTRVAQVPTSTEEQAVSAHIGTTTVTSLIVAPDEIFSATAIDSIQDSFSDPVSVSVDPNNPNTGIITPEFKEGKGEPYRFLMVPVTTETQ